MRLSLHHRLLIAFLVSTAVVFAVVFALGEINAHALWLQMLGVAFSAIVITVVSRKFSERVGRDRPGRRADRPRRTRRAPAGRYRTARGQRTG